MADPTESRFHLSVILIPGQRIHIVGISGFGMSAIARVLLETGYTVTGSDQRLSPLAEALVNDGVEIHIGHDAGHVVGVEVVLASSAIPDDNVEIRSAESLGIPVLRRRDAIAMITSGHRTIAVAGTHGKTTTTALLTHVLIEAGLEPTYIVGGVMNNTATNAGVGSGDIFVIEADEYGEMFLGLHPYIAVVTNIEFDHPDAFDDMKALTGSFRRFLAQLDPNGLLVACADSLPVAALATNRFVQGLAVSTYGLKNPQAAWRAIDIDYHPQGGMTFEVLYGNSSVGTAHVNLMGEYNVENALAVMAVAHELDVPMDTIFNALATFEGTGRRGEIIGAAFDVTVVSDYAHHPTAIDAALKAWSQHPDTRRLWAVWQPHTYTRMRALADEFAGCFSHANFVLVTDVYSVRETLIEGLTVRDMVANIQAAGQPYTYYAGSLAATTELLAAEVQPGDTVVILSAGDAPKVGKQLLDKLSRRSGSA